MKNTLWIALLLIIPQSVLSQQKEWTDEQKAIIQVVENAYISGIHNNGNLEETEKGFHPGFDLLIKNQNQLEKLPIYTWVERSKLRQKNDPAPPQIPMTCQYDLIDITGTAAVTKIRLSKGEQLIFTDYLFLYKFEEGWRIVSKVYADHRVR